MRPRELSTYLRLRSLARNPWETSRFERRLSRGHVHVVQLNGGPYLYLRAGCGDFRAFERVFLEDVYEVARTPPGGWGVVLDLGGHVGLFAARISRTAERVISYEPALENYACLARNIAACLNVETVCAAVAGATGPLRLYHPQSPGSSTDYSCYLEASSELSPRFSDVAGVTLEDVFARHAIRTCNLLKLSVMGQEYDIVYSAAKSTLERIERIHGAYHDVAAHRPRTRIENFARYLSANGFETDVVPEPGAHNRGYFFAFRR